MTNQSSPLRPRKFLSSRRQLVPLELLSMIGSKPRRIKRLLRFKMTRQSSLHRPRKFQFCRRSSPQPELLSMIRRRSPRINRSLRSKRNRSLLPNQITNQWTLIKDSTGRPYSRVICSLVHPLQHLVVISSPPSRSQWKCTSHSNFRSQISRLALAHTQTPRRTSPTRR